MKMAFQLGLIKQISDESNHIISTLSKDVVVILDRYPKAKYHYLVCVAQIKDIFNLKREHLPLLNEMNLLAVNVIEVSRQSIDDFKIGFHAQNSMIPLHMHVISKDFVSDSLKTKKHWNSFTTKYFRPYEDVYSELEQKGFVEHWPSEELKKLLNMDLACNQCSYVAKNMPCLKQHLLEHYND